MNDGDTDAEGKRVHYGGPRSLQAEDGPAAIVDCSLNEAACRAKLGSSF